MENKVRKFASYKLESTILLDMLNSKLNRLNRQLFFALLCVLLMGVSDAFGQPPNDDCSTAQFLCQDESTMGTTAGASPGIDICFTSHASVWYSFTTNDDGGNVNVIVSRNAVCNPPSSTGNGLQGVVFTAATPCDVLTMAPVSNCVPGETGFVLSAPGLLPNTQYWVQVDALVNNQGDTTSCDFGIIVSGPGVSVNAGQDKTIVAGQSITLDGSGADTYSWNPTNTLDNPSVATPLANPTETTTYTVTGTRDGCTSTDEVTIFIDEPIKAPNAFTPNGDGYNDGWEIEGIERFPNAIVEVYSRWGQRVFSSVGYVSPWDGTSNGNYIPEGTYYWVIQLNDEGLSGDEPLTGYVAIIR